MAEYFRHVLKQFERSKPAVGGADAGDAFRFQYEERLECNSSHHVRYRALPETMVLVPLSLRQATNMAAVDAYEARVKAGEAAAAAQGAKFASDEPVVKPHIALTTALGELFAGSVIDGWFSPAAQAVTSATKTTRFASFPKYLVLAANRFYLSETWQAKKLGTVPSRSILGGCQAKKLGTIIGGWAVHAGL